MRRISDRFKGIYELLTVGLVASGVGVPVDVLTSWGSVQVNDSVDTVLGALNGRVSNDFLSESLRNSQHL